MSDSMRKGLGEQASEKITPDSQKSTTQKASESLTGAGDRVAGAVQPEGQKSTGQKVGDATRSGGDDASNQGKGIMESTQDTLSGAAEGISNALGGGQKK
ncbi:chaperone heat shock protein hsp12 [Stemphylium lycopersici]|uniref:Chaperone heat shock protein hsp12 n=1 Tax=Stemphylium lycopersici TaxID=183478 RepID=A0A364NAW5_STELY|nr:chaperone heat shock protein hsp12 [Stemphylium lycopersici]RAR02899.1 chaperone heat shock protein hsp12 [Stemphylium lycopersici]RAR14406.1 chaperone heat shock protein hsp12 [Stemphylium lycopersici]